VNAPEATRERGFALVTVLWSAMLFALITASVLAMAHGAARTVRNHAIEAHLAAAADAAMNIVVLRLLDPAAAARLRRDGTEFDVSFAGHEVRANVQDETGRIDLNAASDTLLQSLLTSNGVDFDTAQSLTDRILDWREPGSAKRLNGAKAEEYRQAGFPYSPRNGPFATVEELKLVMGMTEDLFERLAPAMTVYSQSPLIDTDIAPRAVLRALPTMDEDTVSALLLQRQARFDDDNPAPMVAGAEPVVLVGRAFTITATAVGPDLARVTRIATIRLTGHTQTPFWIYRWN